jgi:hypothetical protein
MSFPPGRQPCPSNKGINGHEAQSIQPGLAHCDKPLFMSKLLNLSMLLALSPGPVFLRISATGWGGVPAPSPGDGWGGVPAPSPGDGWLELLRCGIMIPEEEDVRLVVIVGEALDAELAATGDEEIRCMPSTWPIGDTRDTLGEPNGDEVLEWCAWAAASSQDASLAAELRRRACMGFRGWCSRQRYITGSRASLPCPRQVWSERPKFGVNGLLRIFQELELRIEKWSFEEQSLRDLGGLGFRRSFERVLSSNRSGDLESRVK